MLPEADLNRVAEPPITGSNYAPKHLLNFTAEPTMFEPRLLDAVHILYIRPRALIVYL